MDRFFYITNVKKWAIIYCALNTYFRVLKGDFHDTYKTHNRSNRDVIVERNTLPRAGSKRRIDARLQCQAGAVQ